MRTHLLWIRALTLAGLFGAAACQRESKPDTLSDSPETSPLEIELEVPDEVPTGEGEPVDETAGLYERVYAVPQNFPSMAPGAGGGAAAPDPFAAPAGGGSESSSPRAESTGKNVLEAYGVGFPEGAGAVYDPATGKLTVTATADQLALVDAVMESIQSGMEKMINIRAEIFEIPAIQALELEQSAEARDNHLPEWKAVLEKTGKGGARFVTSASIHARSGQRAKFEDVRERTYVSDYDWADKEKKERMVPVFESRKFGATLEVDPVLGPDDLTIDLNFNLEYHSAPPAEVINRVRFPGSDRVIEVPTLEFHPKSVTTAITLHDGQVKLVGAWRPTGKPEYENADLMHVAFLKVDIQPVFRVGRVR